jgi:hypothetical protein
MTDGNKKENIASELLKSAEMLSEAELLFNNGYFTGAVSRLYYALLHNIRGLLLTKGLEPKSHEGALRLFSLHFVKDGPFIAGDSHIFSRLMKYREEADYNPAYLFSKEDYKDLRKSAMELNEKIKDFLHKNDYISDRH